MLSFCKANCFSPDEPSPGLPFDAAATAGRYWAVSSSDLRAADLLMGCKGKAVRVLCPGVSLKRHKEYPSCCSQDLCSLSAMQEVLCLRQKGGSPVQYLI